MKVPKGDIELNLLNNKRFIVSNFSFNNVDPKK
jgi:hypothetical protein